MRTSDIRHVLDVIDAGTEDFRIHYPNGGQFTYLVGAEPGAEWYGWILSIGPGWCHMDDLDDPPRDTLRSMMKMLVKVGIEAVVTGKDGFTMADVEGLE